MTRDPPRSYALLDTYYLLLAATIVRAETRNDFGLRLPDKLDASRPLVILIHGIDCNEGVFWRMQGLLAKDGWQVGAFNYSTDLPIAQASDQLARELTAYHKDHPDQKLELISHSMGGLVARQYVEGKSYAGGVDHLILIAPPNHGSEWANFEFLSRIRQHIRMGDKDAEWHALSLLNQPLSAAAQDLLPDSKFLNDLNTLPRRDGVHYTIIAGQIDDPSQFAGVAAREVQSYTPARLKWMADKVAAAADKLAEIKTISDGDGVVSLDSAKLDGVTDFKVVKSDHITLCQGREGIDPTAWPTIKDRLSGKTQANAGKEGPATP